MNYSRGKNPKSLFTGKFRNSPPANNKPSKIDLVWLSALFEGEGHIQLSGQMFVTQCDEWVTNKFKKFLGGTITKVNPRGLSRKISYRWYVSGSRARGIMLTFYSFLSPRLQNRIRDTLKFSRRKTDALL